jgi:hypothetical protein
MILLLPIEEIVGVTVKMAVVAARRCGEAVVASFWSRTAGGWWVGPKGAEPSGEGRARAGAEPHRGVEVRELR